MMHQHESMHAMAGFHLVGFLVLALLLVIPLWRLLPKAGIPGWLALFAVFPPAAVILLWVVAFKDAPAKSGEAE